MINDKMENKSGLLALIRVYELRSIVVHFN